MAKATEEVAAGVSEATYNAHQHNYIKVTKIGCDADDKWGSPVWSNIVADGEVHQKDGGTDLEAHGLETATTLSSTPA